LGERLISDLNRRDRGRIAVRARKMRDGPTAAALADELASVAGNMSAAVGADAWVSVRFHDSLPSARFDGGIR
jgi:hypothetical protein